MKNAIRQLDRLLRGDATRMEALKGGELDINVGGIATVGVVLGVIYGLCMGVFSLTQSGSTHAGWAGHAAVEAAAQPGPNYQIIASAMKVPLLFFLTLLVTFPSLYVFNALMGSRLALISVLRLLIASIGIMMTILASLGPIVAFFSLTTSSYPFMTLLNVLVFAISGFLGGAFLLRTLQRLTLAAELAVEAARPPMVYSDPAPESPSAPGLSDDEKAQARARVIVPPPLPNVQSPIGRLTIHGPNGIDVGVIFKIWIVVFGLVGGQMAWIMRPFIGDPSRPFTWFRPTEDNFFHAVWQHMQHLF
jgi:hypothetical protein